MSVGLSIVPVSADNWRDCVGLAVHPHQREFVADVAYHLGLCVYGDTWNPVAVMPGDEGVGFAMWGMDSDQSRWIGGVVVDAGKQGRRSIPRAKPCRS